MFNGPMVWWELVTLARRGHTVRARILLLYTLLLAMILFAFWWFNGPVAISYILGTNEPLTREVVADFARHLVIALLAAQILLVAVVTPAYTAAAISEEKERQTLPLLLTTALTDREIVWGKATARIVFVLAAVASGIPVLLFVMCLGGVEVELIAAGYMLAAGTAILSGSIGIGAACHSPDTRKALIDAYYLSLVSQLPLLAAFAQGLPNLQFICGVVYPALQMAFAWIFLNLGSRSLRNAGATGGPSPPSEFPEPPRGRPEPVGIEPSETGRAMVPLGNADPILWKDRHGKGRSVSWAMSLTAFGAVVALLLFIDSGWAFVKRTVQALDPDHAVSMLRPNTGAPDPASQQLVLAGLIASVLYLLPLTVGITGCIARERLRGTLDSLLATRLDRRRILSAKVRVHAEHGLVFAGGPQRGWGRASGLRGEFNWHLPRLRRSRVGLRSSWGLARGCRCGVRRRWLPFDCVCRRRSLLWVCRCWRGTSPIGRTSRR